ncbi:G5 domain-containing protein [Falseniella ignava]|uniref:G5 domain-containing protein n=1 Tax=Falseniella ignava TaxID=137730 RepID=UPI0011804DA5|nr:G5 domain-containing protein [Falseniella ignava]
MEGIENNSKGKPQKNIDSECNTEDINANDVEGYIIETGPVVKVIEKQFNTEYIYDENLQAGLIEEEIAGKNGKITMTISYDTDIGQLKISEIEEPATNRVIRVGGKTTGEITTHEKIPFKVEIKTDETLKKGEWSYGVDKYGKELRGENGEQSITQAIINSKLAESSNLTIKSPPRNAVILVGIGENTDVSNVSLQVEERKYKENNHLPPLQKRTSLIFESAALSVLADLGLVEECYEREELS